MPYAVDGAQADRAPGEPPSIAEAGWAFPLVGIVLGAIAWGARAQRVGLLTIVVRLTNPAYFEGVVFAILLASIFAPLCDYFVVERNIKRRQARLVALGAGDVVAATEVASTNEASA